MNEKIVYAAASAAGKELQSLATSAKSDLSSISSLMDGVSGSAWQSANAANLRSKFDSLSQNFEKVYEAINTMGAAIEASGTAYENMQ